MVAVGQVRYTADMAILLLHISIALTSIIVSGTAYFKPSRRLLRLTAALIAGTLASGTYLVLANTSHLASACVSGLLYLAVVGSLAAAARYKLAHAETQR
jgi:hypothetical protein